MIDEAFIATLCEGNVAAIARAVSIVENQSPGFESLLAGLQPRLGRARRIGVTGPPGAGKSTLVEGLAGIFRQAGLRVGIVAVDPTSPFSGGALLGDRIRMETLALDPGVFIRSMATRGSLGGLTTATGEVCDLLDAAGFDRILVETVGVGQSELDVATVTDLTLLVVVPESGDSVQTLKSGVMEAADILIVNKSDRPGADRLSRDIELSLDLRAGGSRDSGMRPPVLRTTAVDRVGLAEVAAAMDNCWIELEQDGALASRRRGRAESRTRAVVDRIASRWLWTESPASAIIAQHRDALSAGTTSPYRVAAEIIAAMPWNPAYGNVHSHT